MRKIKLFLGASILLLSGQVTAAPILFDDGGTHNINSVVSDGIIISNSSTVNVQTGASISGLVPPPGSGITMDGQGGNINVQGGLVNGNISFKKLNMSGGLVNGSILSRSGAAVFDMSGGVITGRVDLLGSGTNSISGGVLQSGLFIEGVGTLDISGGTIFNQVSTFGFPEINISGGTFIGGVTDALLLLQDFASINISGGIFSSDIGFEYSDSPGSTGQQEKFKFFGDLMMSTPSLISDRVYETRVTGTLLDGNYLSQRIECRDSGLFEKDPCGGVKIHFVPAPPVIWLFGIGLVGLIGFTRRKKSSLILT